MVFDEIGGSSIKIWRDNNQMFEHTSQVVSKVLGISTNIHGPTITWIFWLE